MVDARVVVAPPPTRWVVVLAVAFSGLAVAGFGASVPTVVLTAVATVLARAVRRAGRTRGVWATDDELIVGTIDGLVPVAKRGANVRIAPAADLLAPVDTALTPHGPSSRLTVVVVPGDPRLAPVPVDAVRGGGLAKLRRTVARIDAELTGRPALDS